MANMLFFLKQRAGTFPYRQLTPIITHFKNQAIACDVNKTNQSFEREQPSSHSAEDHVSERLKIIQSTFGQVQFKNKIFLKGNKQASRLSTLNWLPNNHQNGRFLDGLFGYGRHDVLAYLKRSLGPLSVNYSGQHLIPVRYHSIPSELPGYTPPVDKLGATFTRDLNNEDVERIKYIAKEHFKSLLEANKVKYKKSKSSPSTKDKGVFSTALSVLVEKDLKLNRIKPKSKIPAVVHLMMSYIYQSGNSTEGVFVKQSATQITKELCKDLEDNFYKNPNYTIDRKYTPVDVAVVMTEFLKQLPAPLVSTTKVDVYPEVCSLSFLDKQIKAMNLYFLMMEPAHRETLQILLAALHYSVRKQEVTEADLGVKLGPVLFKMRDKISTSESVTKANEYENLVRVMVHYSDNLFIIPPEILSGLRYQYMVGEKPKFKLFNFPWKKKTEQLKDIQRPTELEVEAPDLPEKTKKIRLDAKTSADDVVFQYTGKNIPRPPYITELKVKLASMRPLQALDDSKESLNLYEVGGNIGERRLHPSTLIQDLYLVNPTAKFVIKA
ncbi:unnamed protein product [Lymnaea stagnalis]|uniref:Rho-GAP domain-containing protein n=1 Tax=Lymnaea stagnalis TaxID=6523 RepID=A0AAV2IET3_LYMST